MTSGVSPTSAGQCITGTGRRADDGRHIIPVKITAEIGIDQRIQRVSSKYMNRERENVSAVAIDVHRTRCKSN